jgi:hypothetical protein
MKPMQLCLAPAATLAALLVVTPASAQGGKSVERLYILNAARESPATFRAGRRA